MGAHGSSYAPKPKGLSSVDILEDPFDALVKLGVKNLVVAPKAMGQGGKKQKTDKRDSLHSCPWRDRVRSSCSCSRDRWRRLPDCFFRGCVFALCFSFGESFSVF